RKAFFADRRIGGLRVVCDSTNRAHDLGRARSLGDFAVLSSRLHQLSNGTFFANLVLDIVRTEVAGREFYFSGIVERLLRRARTIGGCPLVAFNRRDSIP